MQFEHMIRMGTHSEKDYLLKVRSWYDGIVLNANLVEASSSSLAVFLTVLEKEFFVDPVTYAFALNPNMLVRDNVPDGDKGTIRALKRTFRKLAERYGSAIAEHAGLRPLEPEDLDHGVCEYLSEAVVEYQAGRLAEAGKTSDDFLGESLGDTDLRPSRTIAPYFYIADQGWLRVNINMLERSCDLAEGKDIPVWGMICLDARHIDDDDIRNRIVRAYERQRCEGFLLWLSDFAEQNASRGQIKGLQKLVSALSSTGRPIVNTYGGYYSALLFEDGMSGISHGIGYGERRSIEPVVGGGLPPARFYLPALHYQIGLADFATLAVSRVVEEYRSEICNCVICAELLKRGIEFLVSQYTQSTPKVINGRLREFSTPFVYDLTRYHFLHNRYLELNELVEGKPRSELLEDLTKAVEKFRPELGIASTGFAKVWAEALK